MTAIDRLHCGFNT